MGYSTQHSEFLLMKIIRLQKLLLLKIKYALKNNGTRGAGVKHYIVKGSSMPEDSFVKNLYGIYQGGDNPQLPKVRGNYKVLFDDYSLAPIDETDANVK